MEQSYEKELHGITGVEQVETSAGGRAVRKLASSPATPGNTVMLALDIKLQKLIEDMYGDRRGALVALDPKTGEVLAFVSKPTFDPNLFVDGIDSENWQMLNESIEKPLLNRAMRGTYPPGSTYKPFMAMAALETGKRSAGQVIHDGGTWSFGGHVFRSHGDHGLGAVDMHRAIALSSNVYFYSLANEMGVDAMHDFMKPLGFGQHTGIDIQGELRGILPSQEWKRNYYKRPEQKKWFAGETISLGIGQGYNSFTMLQLAQATATLVNNGVKHKPRIVIATQDAISHAKVPMPAQPPENLNFKPENVAVVRKAMVAVTQEGTSTRVFAGAGYLSGGKTGTAQAVTIGQREKYNAGKLEEHQRDHALYIAFAPADDPKIAIAAVVENAGFGAASAAPITRRIFDYWLMGLYPSEEDLAAVKKGQAGPPIGKQRNAADVAWPPGECGSGTRVFRIGPASCGAWCHGKTVKTASRRGRLAHKVSASLAPLGCHPGLDPGSTSTVERRAASGGCRIAVRHDNSVARSGLRRVVAAGRFHQPAAHFLRHPSHMSRHAPIGKSNMSAIGRLPQRHVRPHLMLGRQAGGRHEWVVQRVQRQSGNADAVQVGLGRCTGVVVVGVAETMQRRGEDVVELVEVARGHEFGCIEQARMLLQFRKSLGLHAAQEHGGVDQPVEAAPDGDGARGQVQRGADRCHRPGELARLFACLAGPAHQRIAAQ